MKSIGNFGGTLYFKEVPIAKFKFDRGSLEYVTLLTDDKKVLPTLINLYGPEKGITMFFEDRCTPETRIGLAEELANTPIQYYSVERLLRWNHAQLAHDRYWVKQDTDKRCWEGSSLEGVGVKPNMVYNDLLISKIDSKNEASRLIEEAAEEVEKRFREQK